MLQKEGVPSEKGGGMGGRGCSTQEETMELEKIYTSCYLHALWKVHIFLGETQNGMKDWFCLSIFGLKQDNFQKTKFETVISVAYGTAFVYSMASIVFYLACLFVLCLYLLAYFTY